MSNNNITIYFATNRTISGSDDKPKFGNGFNAQGPQVFRVGSAEVKRESRRKGKYKFLSARLEPENISEDPKERVVGSQNLFDTLRKELKGNGQDVLIYIHGFGHTFSETAERAAGLYDRYLITPRPGTAPGATPGEPYSPRVFAFSWPSDGEVFPRDFYRRDRDDAEASGLAMARSLLALLAFLKKLNTEERCEQRLHLVAHSMGNWSLRHALLAFSREVGRRPLPRVFEHIFLMAADEDDDCFESELKMGLLPELGRFIHVYHSKNDRALEISTQTKGNPSRLGADGPRNFGGLNARIFAIDCRDVDWTDLDDARHQYYRLRPEVIADVCAVLSDVPFDKIPTRELTETPRRFRIKASG